MMALMERMAKAVVEARWRAVREDGRVRADERLPPGADVVFVGRWEELVAREAGGAPQEAAQ